jgi:hypothetical protein
MAGEHNKIAWVSYAGLATDPYNKLARKYCPKGAGAVLTFGLKGGYDAGVKLVSNVQLFSHLANIGDTRSLIIHPASTTHRQLTDAQKVQAGAGRTWCASLSGWKTRKTSSPIWNRPWLRRNQALVWLRRCACSTAKVSKIIAIPWCKSDSEIGAC